MAGVGTTGIPNAFGGGMSSLSTSSSKFGRAPGAPIKRPKVGGPNRGDYAVTSARPVIGPPARADFGPGPGMTDITNARTDVKNFRKGFNDPTKTSAFASLMGLAQEKTASAQSEIERGARDATSRAGYSGGFNADAKQAARDRMSAVAETGFAGAAQIRGEELKGYEVASGNLATQVGSYNDAMTRVNTAFGNALASSRETQGQLDLGFADLVTKSNLSYADAAAQAKQLQAQLDQAYNSSLIDNAKYTQMQRSLDAEFARADAALKEKAREFDLSRKDALTSTDRAWSAYTHANQGDWSTPGGVRPKPAY